jgi:glycosyltransferase involved in cell wall biosynthesis
MKKVACYIPCFNARKTIGPCLEAVLAQTYPVSEVVVVDDGSTDGTADEALKFKVRVIRHAKNEGLARARNSAIQGIDADYIASVDSDCKPDTDWLAVLMAHFTSDTVGGCGGKLTEYYREDVCDLWRSIHMRQYWDDGEKDPAFLFGSNCVHSKRALIDAGLYSDKFKSNYEDVDISKRLKGAGYSLIYEPAAAAVHLRRDDVRTVLNGFWNWYSFFYREREYYSGPESFLAKIRDNIGLANRFIDEDLAAGKEEVLYLDFLLAIHHSLRDFMCFTGGDTGAGPRVPADGLLPAWLSLLDLTFFYHYDKANDGLRTLMPGSGAFFQNLFALELVISRTLRGKFSADGFKKKIFGDILVSVSGIRDEALTEKLFALSESHRDWSGFVTKKQAHIDSAFLGALSEAFGLWADRGLMHRPGLFSKIEQSSRRITP